MKTIKKTICLETVRTRTQGLMPYYEIGVAYDPSVPVSKCNSISDVPLTIASGDNGNWGQIVANPCFLSNAGKTYQNMLFNYYSILNMVRSGKKLRKVMTKNNEIIFVEDLGSFSYDYNSECFTDNVEPETLYEYAAYQSDLFRGGFVDDFDTMIYRAEDDMYVPEDFIVLISDYEHLQGLSDYFKNTEYLVALDKLRPIDIYNELGDEHTKWARYCSVVDLCIGKINVPSSIYNNHIKAPKAMPCSEVSGYLKWLQDNKNLTGNCCNKRLWYDMGGDDMIDFLLEHTDDCETFMDVFNGLTYSVPYIEVPLLLEQNFTDVGVLSSVDGEPTDDSGNPITHMESNRETYPTTEEYTKNPSAYTNMPIEVESFIKTLAGNKRFLDDDNNVLPGLFKKFKDADTGEIFEAGKYFECFKNDDDEWEISGYTGNEDDLMNADGKESEELESSGNTKFYRNVTTVGSAKRICEVYDAEKDEDSDIRTFYFKVKYDNTQDSLMELPYKSGNTANAYFVSSSITEEQTYCIYRGDYLSSVTETTEAGVDYIAFKYVSGGYYRTDKNRRFLECIPGSGDVYYEKYVLDKNHVDYVNLDGVNNVPVYSEYIDFEGGLKEIYSPRFNLYRLGNVANIIEMTTGEYLSLSSYTYNTYQVKEEYLTNISEPPKVNVDVTIDRGGASAFESHYKLTECSTFSDLYNYGNNYFNL